MTTTAKRISPCPPGFSDHVYKVAHGVSVPLRIWPARNTEPIPAPWLLWIHGGSFIGGKHVLPNTWVPEAFGSRGYHIVSIAYRFAPHCGIDDQILDCVDAFKWCLTHLPTILGSSAIDIDRYVVAGDSAGGTCSTLCGHLLDPAPKVVLDLYGVVDATDPWFHVVREDQKNAHTSPYLRERDDAELQKAVEDRDPTKAEVICPWDWELEPNMSVADLQTFWGTPDFVPTEEHYFRMDLVKYLGRHRALFRTLFRRETFASEQEFFTRVRNLSPLFMLDGKTTYPPTFIMHGTGDVTVPVEQSYRMAKRLREMGVEVGEVYKEGGPHCFDQVIEGPGDEGWDEYIVPCMDFLDKHVKA